MTAVDILGPDNDGQGSHGLRRFTSAIFTNAHEAMVVADHNGLIQKVNPSFGQLTGCTKENSPHTLTELFFSGPDDDLLGTRVWEQLAREGRWGGVCNGPRPDGGTGPFKVRIIAAPKSEDYKGGYLAIFHSLAGDSAATDSGVGRQDLVTGLPGRMQFNQSLSRRLGLEPQQGQLTGLLVLNLDNFTNVNNSLGQAVGDQLLREVAGRLLSCVRAGDRVARVGGDEFCVLVNGLADLQSAELATRRILLSLNDPIVLQGRELFVSASVGLALYPDHGQDAESLMRAADLAMRQAKRAGKKTFVTFAPGMSDQHHDRLQLEADLRHGVTHEEFVVHYQPIVDTRSSQVLGMEALVRWMRPGVGMVFPDQFISAAEDNGLIVPIGEWVLEEACRQTQEWRKQGHRDLRLAVNLSARQLLWQHDFVDMIESVLGKTGLPATNLELEMTESVVMHSVEGAIATMSKLRAMGVRLSLDDFGTGYSSLNYLKRFPLDCLKIDRSFIGDIPQDPDGVAIVEGILTMAQSLNLEVVAEGVERQEQLDFLKERRCQRMQGYLFSPPVAAEEFGAFLPQK